MNYNKIIESIFGIPRQNLFILFLKDLNMNIIVFCIRHRRRYPITRTCPLNNQLDFIEDTYNTHYNYETARRYRDVKLTIEK